jgi:hypothetical protein
MGTGQVVFILIVSYGIFQVATLLLFHKQNPRTLPKTSQTSSLSKKLKSREGFLAQRNMAVRPNIALHEDRPLLPQQRSLRNEETPESRLQKAANVNRREDFPVIEGEDSFDEERKQALSYVRSFGSRLDRQKRPLKFFHIPKTAGTAIEYAAGSAEGLLWGSCLFNHKPKREICRYPRNSYEWWVTVFVVYSVRIEVKLLGQDIYLLILVCCLPCHVLLGRNILDGGTYRRSSFHWRT